jgi:hypothetical protein
MRYRDRLQRWMVVRHLPQMQRATLARFSKESDADGYAQALRRLDPAGEFVVVFDPPELEPPALEPE